MEIINHDDLLALIAENLEGCASSYETLRLNRWLESSERNRRYFEEIKNIWDVSDSRFNSDTIDTNKALNNILNKIDSYHNSYYIWYYWQKIAAILILPLIILSMVSVYIGLNNKRASNSEVAYHEVHAAFGTRSSLLLADSTLVWLNSGSSLKYPVSFNNGERKVYLSGEGYFDVESDELKPFIVETATLQVRATGTVFNVQEYDNNEISEVVLLSGKLVVNESDAENGNKLISELEPNQLLKYNRETKERHISYEEAYTLVAWKDGRLVFRNETLSDVLKKISMMFNVDIELRGDELKSYRYRATFQDESLEEILKLLKLSAPLDYREIERYALPDGSFPKKKVIIYPIH